MKARNNRTGEIVTNFFMAKEFGTISYLDSSKTLRLAHACDGEWTILEDENDDFSNSFDWQSFRAEAAKDILCAMLTDQRISETMPYKDLVKMSLECTDELIKQQRKGGEMKSKELMIGFKYIPQYENLYSIDRSGNVFSHISGKFLKPHPNYSGYLMVDLYKDGKVKKGVIHRLVAITYIPNPNNLPEIDHIDTDRQNNNVDNLRWCTRQENCNNVLTLKHAGDSRKGEKHYLYGKTISEETKTKMSASHLGHTVSEVTRHKISNTNTGHIMSEEQKHQLSESHKGKKMGKDNPNAKEVTQYNKQGVIMKVWSCISEASRELGISVSSISNCIKGLSKTAGGFIWKS